MTTNIDRAGLVARHVALESVTLSSAEVRSSINPLVLPPELQLSNRFRARFQKHEADSGKISLWVYVDFNFEATPPVSDAVSEPTVKIVPTVKLAATFLLIYSLPTTATIPEDAFEHFANVNGPYNAWPYWRELVQTMTGRVGLSGIVLPVFRPTAVRVDVTPAEKGAVDGAAAEKATGH